MTFCTQRMQQGMQDCSKMPTQESATCYFSYTTNSFASFSSVSLPLVVSMVVVPLIIILCTVSVLLPLL